MAVRKAEVIYVGDAASLVRAAQESAKANEDSANAIVTAFGRVSKAAKAAGDAAAAGALRSGAGAEEAAKVAGGAAAKQAKAVGDSAKEQEAAYARAADAARAAAIKQDEASKLTMSGVASRAKSVGSTLTTGLTIPIAAVGYAAAKMGIDFQKQMLLIHTQAGASTAEVKQLSGAVLHLAEHSQQGPVKLAEALYQLESVGIRGAGAMKDLEAASKGAAMGNANLEETTSALAAAYTSWHLNASEANRTMAILDATVGVGKQRMEELVEGMKTGIMPVAQAAGVSLQSLGAAEAVMTDRGVPATRAMTYLRQAIFYLANESTGPAKKALSEIGLTSQEVSKTLASPDGLNNVIHLLHARLQELGGGERLEVLKDLGGGARSATGLVSMYQALENQTSNVESKYKKIGDLSASFGQRVAAQEHTTAGELNKAWSSIQVALVHVGEIEAPVLRTLAGGLAAVARAFSALPAPVRDVVGGLALVGAAAGPVLIVFGSLSSAALKINELWTALGARFTTTASEDLAANEEIAASSNTTSALVIADSERMGTALSGFGYAAEASGAKAAESVTAATRTIQVDASTMGASMEGFGAAVTAAEEETSAKVAAMAGSVEAADTEIATANEAAGKSFTAMLGPIGAVFAAVTSLQPLIQSVTGGGLTNTSAADQKAGLGITEPLQSGRATDIEQFLFRGGLTTTAAQGVARALFGESGLSPTDTGGEGAYGVAQWTGTRLEGLRSFVGKHHVSGNSLEAQLAYLLYELETSERSTMGAVNKAKSPMEAARIFVEKFERPKKEDIPAILERAAHMNLNSQAPTEGGAGGGIPKNIEELIKQAESTPGPTSLGEGGAAKSKKAKQHLAALGIPPAVATMLSTIHALIGAPYTRGGGHGSSAWDPVQTLKQIGIDCSGFVSRSLAAGGIRNAAGLTTEGLPQVLSPGAGRYVTVFDRANAGMNSHAFEEVLGHYFESGGRSGKGVHEMTKAEVAAELAGGGFAEYHPASLNTPVRGGLTQASLLQTAGVNAIALAEAGKTKAIDEAIKRQKELAAAYKEQQTAEQKWVKEGQQRLKAFNEAIRSVGKELTADAKQAASAWKSAQKELIDATHEHELEGLEEGPQAKALEALKEHQDAIEDTREHDKLVKNLKKAHEEGDKEAIEEAQNAISDYETKEQEKSLEKSIATAKKAADDKQKDATTQLGQETEAYEDNLNNQFSILTAQLKKRELSYATFAANVNKMLAAAELTLNPSEATQSAITGYGAFPWNTNKVVVAQKSQPHASGGAALAGQPYWVGETGPERFTPSTSGTITPASRSGVDAGAGINVEGDLIVTDTQDAEKMANRLAFALRYGGQTLAF